MADPDHTEPHGTDDPRAIRTVAVTVDDVVAALEANRSADRGAVLRITPPFSGRMRARIHVGGTGDYATEPEPIHLAPERLVADVPEYPTADETEPAASDSATTLDIEARRQRHTERVASWRETVRQRLADTVDIETPAGDHTVRVIALGE